MDKNQLYQLEYHYKLQKNWLENVVNLNNRY